MFKPKALTPDPHMLRSIRARGYTLSNVLGEFIDNSLSEHKGNAQFVRIGWINWRGQKAIGVYDDGDGMPDINMLFKLGASSTYNTEDIGLFGVGATNSAIWLADAMFAATIHNGRYYQHHVSWSDALKAGEWPAGYEGRGTPVEKANMPAAVERVFEGRKRGTVITLAGLRQMRILPTSLERDLGITFAPALRAGRRILLTPKGKDSIEVKPFQPPELTDVIEISDIVEGHDEDGNSVPLRWTGRGGISQGVTDDLNSTFIGFAHRVIERTRDPFAGYDAPTIYAEVDLASEWKYSLSDNKDKITHNRDALMASIRAQLKPLLELAQRQQDEIAIQSLVSTLTVKLNGLVAEEPAAEGEDEQPLLVRPRGERRPNPEPSDPTPPDVETTTVLEDEAPDARKMQDGEEAGAIVVKTRDNEWMQGRIARAEIGAARIITVYLNKENEWITGAAVADPANSAVVLTHIAYTIALEAVAEVRRGNRGLIESMFPTFVDQVDTILTSQPHAELDLVAALAGSIHRIESVPKRRRRRRRNTDEGSWAEGDISQRRSELDLE